MAIDTASRVVYMSKQAALGTGATDVDKLVPIVLDPTSNDGVRNITNRLDRSLAEDKDRLTTTRDSTIPMTADASYEVMAWVQGMAFGTGTALGKTILDSTASSTPNIAARFNSSVPTTSRPGIRYMTMFHDDGDRTDRYEDMYLENFTFAVTAGEVAQLTGGLTAQFGEEETSNYTRPSELPGVEYIPAQNWDCNC